MCCTPRIGAQIGSHVGICMHALEYGMNTNMASKSNMEDLGDHSYGIKSHDENPLYTKVKTPITLIMKTQMQTAWPACISCTM